MRDNDHIILESLYTKIIKESVSAKDFVKILAGDSKEQRELLNPLMGNAANYTNDEGVEVSIKDDDPPLVEFDGEEYAGDIELNYIGIENVDQRNKGAASRELDRIVAEADKYDLSISLTIDPYDATSRGGTMGLKPSELKKWYQKRGFIFNKKERIGYRPKKSEKREEIEPKMMIAKVEDIPKVEEDINEKGEFQKWPVNDKMVDIPTYPRTWSDDESMFEAYVSRNVSKEKKYSPEILKGYQVSGEDIFYYDGINRPIMVDNLKADYDYKQHRHVVKLIDI
jgi:hypothetical protein